MPRNFTEYRGYHIKASYYHAAGGFVPRVVVSRHRESGISELSLSPPCPHRGVETEIEAFAVGFAYAKAAIDGRVSGIDISKL